MPENELLTVPETADYLRLTRAALYGQRHRGEMPGRLGIKVGKKIVYRRSDIEQFIDDQIAAQCSGGDE